MIPLPDPALELRAATIEKALPLIGAQYGTRLRAAPAIAGEIVIARLDGAPLAEVEAHLASAFAAEWRTASDGTLVLAPSAKLRTAEARVWRVDRLARLSKALKPLRERLAKATPVNGDSARQLREWQAKSKMRNGEAMAPAPWTGTFLTPITRLKDALLTTIPPDDLLPSQEQDFGERRVFALDPTPRERSLPPSARAEVARYATDAAVLDPNIERPARVTLTVLPNGNLPLVELWVYSGAGRLIARANDSLDIYPPEPSVEGDPIPYSLVGYDQGPEAKAYSIEKVASVEGMTPAARSFFDVLAREPLSGITSETLLSAARLADRNLIVAPDDAAMAFEPLPERGNLRHVPFLTEGAVNLTPGWLDVRTGNAGRARARFFPRADLALALNLLLKTDGKEVGLATQAAVVSLMPESGDFLPMSYLLMLVGGPGFPYELPLRLLAALTPAEREAAVSPRGLPLGGLTPGTRGRVERLLYARGLGALPGIRVTDASLQPTFACPSGLPSGGWLRLEFASRVRFSVPYDDRVYGTMDLATLERVLTGESASRYGTSAIRLVEEETANVRIIVPPGLEAEYPIVGARRSLSGGPYSPATLPEPYRSELRRIGKDGS